MSVPTFFPIKKNVLISRSVFLLSHSQTRIALAYCPFFSSTKHIIQVEYEREQSIDDGPTTLKKEQHYCVFVNIEFRDNEKIWISFNSIFHVLLCKKKEVGNLWICALLTVKGFSRDPLCAIKYL